MWKPFTALFAAILVTHPAHARPPEVVVSIQPLHSLVAGVMEGVGEPALVVSGAASEHTYAMKPSDARMLETAGLVVMVDKSYETFLAKPLRRRDVAVVEMAALPGVATLPLREGGVWKAHAGEDHGHEKALDFHVWLDPVNAKALTGAVADRLAQFDPANAQTYRANAARQQARLDALDVELTARLAMAASRPYVVFHDAFQYFEARYGLSPAGSITVDPERPPSAKRLAALRDRLRKAGASCVFREPQFPAPVVETLAKSAGARVGMLDPQGAAIPPGPDHYFKLMAALADGLTECLSAK